MSNSNKAIKAIAAMICITILEVAALFNNIDGIYLSLAVGAIAGLGGYIVAKST